MAAEFFDIPGNIKQMSLPFKLDPNARINTDDITYKSAGESGQTDVVIASPNAGSMKPQVFSFRPGTRHLADENLFALIHVAPQSFYNSSNSYVSEEQVHDYDLVNQDLSLSSIYGPDIDSTVNSQFNMAASKNTAPHMSGVLDNIPYVQVREYLQDAKLTQILTLMSNVAAGWQSSTQMHDSNGSLTEVGKRIWHSAKAITMNVKDVIAGAIPPNLESWLRSGVWDGGSIAEYSDYVLWIPYILYYRLLSSTTTNIYELPYNGKILDTSDGHIGYNAKGLNGLTMNGESWLGTLWNFIGSNIRVNTTPTWDGTNQTAPLEIKIDVQLFNDSMTSAIENFILVNTLIPGNKWMQYHVYQHAPNLYDLRIDGVNRLFMCAGKFEVEQKGVLRAPSTLLLQNLFNYACPEEDGLTWSATSQMLESIRIPDVYELHLTFTSLLPNNFNNYLYRYYQNTSVIDHPVREESVFNPISKRITSIISDVYNQPGIITADTAEKQKQIVDVAINNTNAKYKAS